MSKALLVRLMALERRVADLEAARPLPVGPGMPASMRVEIDPAPRRPTLKLPKDK